jgi:hypothetical protein
MVAAGCERPTGGLVEQEATKKNTETKTTNNEKGVSRMIRVGQKAPDFEAPAYYKGEFTAVKLSDYLGKWVALCFYPGDFTFV